MTLEGSDIEGLRREIAELHRSRKRLVAAADGARRVIERELHNGVQQRLVALAVNLQLASQALDADPAQAKTLLDSMTRDVQQAMDDAAQLAQKIYPPLLDAGGLAAALRAAAVTAGIRASLEIPPGASYPPEVAAALYWCCLDVFEHAGGGASATVTLREGDGVVFDLVCDRPASDEALQRIRDRVEALGGTVDTTGGTTVSGSFA